MRLRDSPIQRTTRVVVIKSVEGNWAVEPIRGVAERSLIWHEGGADNKNLVQQGVGRPNSNESLLRRGGGSHAPAVFRIASIHSFSGVLVAVRCRKAKGQRTEIHPIAIRTLARTLCYILKRTTIVTFKHKFLYYQHGAYSFKVTPDRFTFFALPLLRPACVFRALMLGFSFKIQ